MSAKQEEDPLSLTEAQEIKREPEEYQPYTELQVTCNKDVKHEIKPDEEKFHEISRVDLQEPIFMHVASLKTLAELQDEQVFLDEKPRNEEKNTEHDGINVEYSDCKNLQEEVTGFNVDMNSKYTQNTKKWFQFQVCNKSSPMDSTLNQQTYINVNENIKLNSNTFCKQSQPTQDMFIHTDYTQLKCNICVNSSSEISDQMRLIKCVHTNEKPLKFNYCQKCDLLRRTCFHANEKSFKCDLCWKKFSQKSDLNRHTLIHTNEKPFKCRYCQKRFSRKTHLNTHTRVHTNKKPFKCDYCQKTFCQKSHLTDHTHVHTNVKPFKCDYCQKTFSLKSVLIRHTRIHENDKPFKCNDCQKRFSQKCDLIRHTRIHTNEKPFQCDFCQKFSQKSDLVRHTRIHTKEKPFTCGYCQKRFSRKSHLNRHTRVHKNVAIQM